MGDGYLDAQNGLIILNAAARRGTQWPGGRYGCSITTYQGDIH